MQDIVNTTFLDADLCVHEVQYRSTHRVAGHVHKQAGPLPDGPKCPLPHKSFCSPGTAFPVQANLTPCWSARELGQVGVGGEVGVGGGWARRA